MTRKTPKQPNPTTYRLYVVVAGNATSNIFVYYALREGLFGTSRKEAWQRFVTFWGRDAEEPKTQLQYKLDGYVTCRIQITAQQLG